MKIDNSIVTIDGKTYPAVGFGTYRLTGKVCQKAVLEAIQTGYRIIDTATYYTNFESIAQAVNGFDRSQFYLISKVWPDMQAPGDLRRDFQKTIKELNIDYLDAYFIHWPNSKLPIEPTLQAMKERTGCVPSGLTGQVLVRQSSRPWVFPWNPWSQPVSPRTPRDEPRLPRQRRGRSLVLWSHLRHSRSRKCPRDRRIVADRAPPGTSAEHRNEAERRQQG